MSVDRVSPFELVTANGAVPDVTGVGAVGWPLIPTGRDDKGPFDGQRANAAALRLPEIEIFQHIDFGGFSARTNLNWYFVGDWWNDKISSIVVVSGTWRFYEHWHYEGRYWDLSEGYYRWVVDAGIPNDIISSFRVIRF